MSLLKTIESLHYGTTRFVINDVFDGKLFSAKFAELQCDETLANTYNHAILVKAMQKATDIHLVSQMIVGDNDIDTRYK